jgi:hypothetical protein
VPLSLAISGSGFSFSLSVSLLDFRLDTFLSERD